MKRFSLFFFSLMFVFCLTSCFTNALQNLPEYDAPQEEISLQYQRKFRIKELEKEIEVKHDEYATLSLLLWKNNKSSDLLRVLGTPAKSFTTNDNFTFYTYSYSETKILTTTNVYSKTTLDSSNPYLPRTYTTTTEDEVNDVYTSTSELTFETDNKGIIQNVSGVTFYNLAELTYTSDIKDSLLANQDKQWANNYLKVESEFTNLKAELAEINEQIKEFENTYKETKWVSVGATLDTITIVSILFLPFILFLKF